MTNSIANRPSERHRAYVRNSHGQLVPNAAYIPARGGKHRAPVGLRPEKDMYVPLKRMNLFELGACLSELRSDKVDLAMDMASYCHRGQLRKEFRAGRPVRDDYVIHPFRNANRIVRWGGDDDQVVIALLHDTVEDAPEKVCEYTGESDPIAGITKLFGHRVAAGVKGMSNDPDMDYREHAREEAKKNPDVLWGKAVDLKDNAGSLSYMQPGPRRDKLVRKYRPLVDDLIGISHEKPGTEKLRGALLEVQRSLTHLSTVR